MTRKTVAVICMLTCAALFAGCDSDGDGGGESEAITYATTVILGTWTWDVDTDTQGGADGDFKLRHVNTSIGEKTLEPKNGTTAVQVYGLEFDDITEAYVQAQPLTGDAIDASNVGGTLTVGSIVVFKTSAGAYGKLRVVRYRESQDFTFDEVSLLSQSIRDFFAANPNIVNYHLEVEWELFE
jgi:hypothetical protein